MTSKTKLILFLFLASATLSLAIDREDPELRTCQHTCRVQKQFGEQQQQECEQACEDYIREKRRQEGGQGQHGGSGRRDWWSNQVRQDPEKELRRCQEECTKQPGQEQSQGQRECQKTCMERYKQQEEQQQQGGGRHGGGGLYLNPQDPQRELEDCRQQCRRQHQGESQQGQSQEELRRCEQSCDDRFQQQQGEQGYGGQEQGYGGQGYGGQRQGESQQQQQQQQQQGGRRHEGEPYVFHIESDRFRHGIRSAHGNMRVLEKFTQRSDLLKGIENYRVVLTEVNPNAFMIPNHWDADGICFVIRGQGTITLLHQENKDTFNVQAGHAFRIRAGTTTHFVNSDNNQQLLIAELVIPVNTPGRFEAFYGPGVGGEQSSYFNVFSDEILRAAFNTEVDQLRTMFRGENKEPFVKASRQQIEAIRKQASSSEGGIWPFHRGGEQQQSSRPINLFKQTPTESNQHGKLFELPRDFRQFQDLDVGVAVAQINQRAMMGPFYNSRSTKIAVVAEGNGYIEMACPHLNQQQGQQGQQQGQQGREEYGGRSQQGGESEGGRTTYQKVRSQVSVGDVIVVPAGHPIVAVASENQNLVVACFEIDVENNQRYALAGKNNVLRQLEDQAMELSFDAPARQVKDVFNKQQHSFFFPGPGQRQQQGGRAEA